MTPVFTRRADQVMAAALVGLILTALSVVGFTYYYAMPSYTRVGYAPTQPVAFSHKIHAGQLGMDCRYCHTHVEESPHSNVPTSQVCQSCHTQIKANSPLLAEVRQSWATGEAIEWERIHKVPEYVYFNHSIHVKRGVSCVSCHGKINEMTVVYHDQPLSMGWCLECHRNPENHLRPVGEVYNLDWVPPTGETQQNIGKELAELARINAPQHCGGCHR
ncbi:quinol:cytochrome c oxidoreductase pentaheme cytochrome subunit [Isosphaera pallida ATCC 43644]|uniref:Quinol:cytochrome c oxidoreductase pentaheme cytochrome subunit n=1 Tax=Isosphaera pallida (strain ATCC 43644 / DSM 9630 / IS1B) TaxID=575540 RepID=E8R1V3_ISOPI|nr:quinol:cytochrome c oxidoreductase pentaheme cytochrome subunit [Isosphaera pallida ATCC 43644]